MTSKSFAERIAEVLIEDGLLLPNQLEEAVSIQKAEGGRLLKILTDKQFVTEQDMAFSTGRCLNTPPINLAKLHVPEEVMALVPRDMAKTNKLVPIARLNGKLFVAMADPTNVLAVDDLKRRVQLEIVPMIATERAVNDALSGVHDSSAKMSQVLKKVAEFASKLQVKRSTCASRFCPRRTGRKSSCVFSINRRSPAVLTRWVWKKGRWKNFAKRSTRRMG